MDTASCNKKAAGETDCVLHHITTAALRCAFYDLKKTASAGVVQRQLLLPLGDDYLPVQVWPHAGLAGLGS